MGIKPTQRTQLDFLMVDFQVMVTSWDSSGLPGYGNLLGSNGFPGYGNPFGYGGNGQSRYLNSRSHGYGQSRYLNSRSHGYGQSRLHRYGQLGYRGYGRHQY